MKEILLLAAIVVPLGAAADSLWAECTGSDSPGPVPGKLAFCDGASVNSLEPAAGTMDVAAIRDALKGQGTEDGCSVSPSLEEAVPDARGINMVHVRCTMPETPAFEGWAAWLPGAERERFVYCLVDSRNRDGLDQCRTLASAGAMHGIPELKPLPGPNEPLYESRVLDVPSGCRGRAAIAGGSIACGDGTLRWNQYLTNPDAERRTTIPVRFGAELDALVPNTSWTANSAAAVAGDAAKAVVSCPHARDHEAHRPPPPPRPPRLSIVL